MLRHIRTTSFSHPAEREQDRVAHNSSCGDSRPRLSGGPDVSGRSFHLCLVILKERALCATEDRA